MSFEKHTAGLFQFWMKDAGSIIYINPDPTMKMGLESLGVQSSNMKVVEDIDCKFRVFHISEHVVEPVINLIPELQDYIGHLTNTEPKREYSWNSEPNLDERMFPYQVEGVKWAIANKGGYIADEPGLGKTIQALQWLENTPYKKALIVAPASVAFNWAAECNEWAKSWMPFTIGTASNLRKVMRDDTYKNSDEKIAYIVTWAQLALSGEPLLDFGFECMICDEAHRAKSMQAKRTMYALGLAKRVSSVLLLSGTPMKSVPAELYPQLRMLTNEFGTFDDFISRYSPPDELISKTGTYKVFRRAKNLPELRQRVMPYMVFRKKADVLQDLPEIRYRKLILPVKNTQMERWAYMVESMQNGMLDVADLIRFRQEIGISKAKLSLDWIEDNSSETNPMVVFFVHKDVRKILEAGLKKKGISFGTIVGETPKKKRAESIEKFQAGKLQVMLCSEAAKEGVTLTRASQLLLLERMWVPTDEEQAEARVHRIGSKNPVVITHAHSEDTIDDLIVSKLAKKREIIQTMFSSHLISDDLLSLFLNQVQL